MREPISVDQSATFDLASIAGEMRASEAYTRTGHTARTMLREPDLRLVLVVIRAGNVIKEHEADDTTSVHTLSGGIRLRLPDRVVPVPAGTLMVLERGLRHAVEALEDSVFLLTLGGHR